MKNFDDENKMQPERYEEVKLKVRTALHIYRNLCLYELLALS